MTCAIEQIEKFSKDESLHKLQNIIQKETLNKKREFNIFKVLKLDNYEIRHSNFLAWLLDPNETHRLNSLFLNQFLKTALNKDISNLINGQNVTIETEYPTNEGRRIDILIHTKDFVCVIENKYGSDEHDAQCKHYKDFIDNFSKFKNCKDKYYIFLDINLPTEKQLKNELNCYRPITYKQVLDLLIGICNTDRFGNDIIINIIQQYIQILEEKYPMMNEEIKEECAKLYANYKATIDSLEEYKTIFQNDVCNIFHEIVENSDLDTINAEAQGIDYNNQTGCAVRFIPKNIDVKKLKQNDEQLAFLFLMLSYKYEDGLKLEIAMRNPITEEEKNFYQKLCEKYSKRCGNKFDWRSLKEIKFETIIGKSKIEIEALIKAKITTTGILEEFKDLLCHV